jgi:hypothetical protein
VASSLLPDLAMNPRTLLPLLPALVACSSQRVTAVTSVQSATHTTDVPVTCEPDEFAPGWVPCDQVKGIIAQSPRDLSDATWGRADSMLPSAGNDHVAPRPASEGLGVHCNSHTHAGVEHMGASPCAGGAAGQGHDECAAVVEGEVLEHHEVYTTCSLPPERKGDLSDCVYGQTETSPCTISVVASFVQIDALSRNRQVTGGNVTKRYVGSTTGQRCGCSKQPVSWQIDTSTCWRVSADTFKNDVCAAGDPHLHYVRPVVTDPALLWSPSR